MRQIYLNGELVPEDQAKVSVFDHGLLYGDGVFEGLRVYAGKVFKLEEHTRRLFDSAKAICLDIGMTPDEVNAAINETVAANELSEGYVRLVVTRGVGNLGLGPDGCNKPQVIIIAAQIALYPQEYYETGLEVITSSIIRNHPAALNPRIKSLNYLNNILAKIEGAQAGCIEAIMLNHKGEVSECTGDNLFLVRDGELFTPPRDAGILDGVTRNVVIELAAAEGIPTQEVPLTRHDVYVADECFLTGTAAEVIAVVKVDAREIGDGKPGPVAKRLKERFSEYARQG